MVFYLTMNLQEEVKHFDKITMGICNILYNTNKIYLGNLDASRDWGHVGLC